MRYLIDSANPSDVKEILAYYPVDGVTTNPTIVAREKPDYKAMLLAMRETIGKRMLHVQTMQTTAEDMVREALTLKQLLGDPFYIKLPACPEGLRALMALREKGVGVTMTAIFSPQQALIAARAGADFVAPYVNKLEDVGDGETCVEKIVQLLGVHHLETKVLSASFRNVAQVTCVALSGSHYITLPPAFFPKLIWHPMTDLAVAGFKADWESVYGDQKPIDLIM